MRTGGIIVLGLLVAACGGEEPPPPRDPELYAVIERMEEDLARIKDQVEVLGQLIDEVEVEAITTSIDEDVDWVIAKLKEEGISNLQPTYPDRSGLVIRSNGIENNYDFQWEVRVFWILERGEEEAEIQVAWLKGAAVTWAPGSQWVRIDDRMPEKALRYVIIHNFRPQRWKAAWEE